MTKNIKVILLTGVGAAVLALPVAAGHNITKLRGSFRWPIRAVIKPMCLLRLLMDINKLDIRKLTNILAISNWRILIQVIRNRTAGIHTNGGKWLCGARLCGDIYERSRITGIIPSGRRTI